MLTFLFAVAVIWLLWKLYENSTDALDKQTAVEFELRALEKKLDELIEVVKASETEKK